MDTLLRPLLIISFCFFLCLSANTASGNADKQTHHQLHSKNTGVDTDIRQIKKELQEIKALLKQLANTKDLSADKPQPSVNIEMTQLPSGLKMGKYEVTQDQWLAVMGSNPSNFKNCGGNCPVEQVSWDDAQSFIKRLNALTGHTYRLPTEDEWYQACQAGSVNPYCGSKDLNAIAWYSGNATNTTHAVGGKKANAFGLFDMSGNVWEWVDGCFENDCNRRIFRGGSWYYTPEYLVADYRGWNKANYASFLIGFRLVQVR